jgi:phosphoribosylaminoimidazolecarboxamide formyltransferase/IMP cyclohydrolase
MKTRTALLSDSNKDGIDEFAAQLVALGWSIFASSDTVKALFEANIPMVDVAELVDLPFIDLVCVGLYPLQEEIGKADATTMSVIEKTDIGGAATILSAVKGGRIVIAEAADRQSVLDWLIAGEPDAESFKNTLAAKAEQVVAAYCLASARYHGLGKYEGIIGTRHVVCSYGENGWQKPAALYSTGTSDPLALDRFQLIQGTGLSYNNWCDVDRLLQTITHIAAAFDVNCDGGVPNIAVGGKHGNPCGAAYGTQKESIEGMVTGDKRAIFGGLVIVNFPLTEELVETLLTFGQSGRRVLDGVIAPSFTEQAMKMLKRKGDKCRLLVNPALKNLGLQSLDQARRFRYVRGGFLTQPNYTFVLDLNDPQLEKIGELTAEQEGQLLLAWAIGSTSNSNTVCLVNDGKLIGNGVGQQDRVGACMLAINRAVGADHEVAGAVAYSDSFFPFPDGPETLVRAGISAILSSSGSLRDNDTRQVCSNNGVSLCLIPDKVGRGFFGH